MFFVFFINEQRPIDGQVYLKMKRLSLTDQRKTQTQLAYLAVASPTMQSALLTSVLPGKSFI